MRLIKTLEEFLIRLSSAPKRIAIQNFLTSWKSNQHVFTSSWSRKAVELVQSEEGIWQAWHQNKNPQNIQSDTVFSLSQWIAGNLRKNSLEKVKLYLYRRAASLRHEILVYRAIEMDLTSANLVWNRKTAFLAKNCRAGDRKYSRCSATAGFWCQPFTSP